MGLSEERIHQLEQLCGQMRIRLIDMLYQAQTGHPGGSLSACEIITLLYQEKMQLNPQNPTDENRDRFILSKGHAVPMLYLNLVEKGFIKEKELQSFRQLNGILQGHPCQHKTPGIDVSTGPLGLGLSVGCGISASAKLKNRNYRTYVILGDGEIQEGAVWEAAMSASKFRLDNLIAILDHNHVQLDGTNDEIMPMGDIAKKFEAFGWNVISCDGHNIADLSEAIDQAKMSLGQEKPTIIIAQTIKGKGISFMEGKNIWHGSPINSSQYQTAMLELGRKMS